MGALGTGLVWVGFATLLGAVAGLVALAAASTRSDGRGRSDRPRAVDAPARAPRATAVLAIVGAVLLVGSLVLPWLRGVGTDGASLTLTGWSGLDPLSIGAVLVGAVLVVVVAVGLVRRSAATLLVAVALGLAALVVGNLLVQADQPGGSRVAPAGFAVALAGAAVVGLAAVVALAPRHRATDRPPPG